ncbi:hypothetical protein ACP26E_12490 [Franconibacter pulveris 601]
MGKGIIRLHDKLSSGGEVISASSTMIIGGINAALLNESGWQQLCHNMNTDNAADARSPV